MAIAAGIKGKKWKLRLKQFLDFQVSPVVSQYSWTASDVLT